VVSEHTRKQAQGMKWLELDRVRVKGKQEAVTIYTPVDEGHAPEQWKQEQGLWHQFLRAYRTQNWDACDVLLLNLSKVSPRSALHQLYISRVSELRQLPFDPDWDGAHRFDSK
jgi:adenylate cyclase